MERSKRFKDFMVAARASDSKIEPQQLPSGYVKVAIGNGHL
jgi:hypothetical protein